MFAFALNFLNCLIMCQNARKMHHFEAKSPLWTEKKEPHIIRYNLGYCTRIFIKFSADMQKYFVNKAVTVQTTTP